MANLMVPDDTSVIGNNKRLRNKHIVDSQLRNKHIVDSLVFKECDGECGTEFFFAYTDHNEDKYRNPIASWPSNITNITPDGDGCLTCCDSCVMVCEKCMMCKDCKDRPESVEESEE
jgi:hypothetical protein